MKNTNEPDAYGCGPYNEHDIEQFCGECSYFFDGDGDLHQATCNVEHYPKQELGKPKCHDK